MSDNWDLAVAERPASDGPGEDRWLFWVSPKGVVWAGVIDGASSEPNRRPDGGDYADALRSAILCAVANNPVADPVEALEVAIADAAGRLSLPKQSSPSAAVGLVRCIGPSISAAVLGDVSIVLCNEGGEQVLRDVRLADVAKELRTEYKQSLKRGSGFNAAHEQAVARLRAAETSVRNTAAGYWIAADDPGAARFALTLEQQLPARRILVASDGAAAALKYDLVSDWAELADLVIKGPNCLPDLIRGAEDLDSTGARWPRSKRHDDIAVMVLAHQ